MRSTLLFLTRSIVDSLDGAAAGAWARAWTSANSADVPAAAAAPVNRRRDNIAKAPFSRELVPVGDADPAGRIAICIDSVPPPHLWRPAAAVARQSGGAQIGQWASQGSRALWQYSDQPTPPPRPPEPENTRLVGAGRDPPEHPFPASFETRPGINRDAPRDEVRC